MNSTGPVHFINLEYFFRLIYTASANAHIGSHTDYGVLLSNIWLIITGLSYALSLAFIGVLVYFTVRLHQVSEEDEEKVSYITPEAEDKIVEHARWAHIQALIESPNENDWRQAIIEADIILDDTLTLQGYTGASVGDKLKQAKPERFHTIRDAWDAHMVRNSIAHQGSEFQLTGQIAYRTISRYMNVFEEFQVI